MALSTIEQISQLLKTKERVLITFRKDGKGDPIMSAIALSLFLEKLGKTVDIICEEFTPPKAYSFLQRIDTIKSQFSHLQKLIVTVDVGASGLSDITYTKKDGKLYIYITPEQGQIDKTSIKTDTSPFLYDVIITVNTQDLESLGALYHDHTEFFHKTPIINIDHDGANEHFGHINHTDLTVSSTAELLFHLKKQLGEEYIDEHIATTLLAGMIVTTRSFKTPNVRPHTLTTASTLMEMGANRDLIIKHLYQTRSLKALKLWGEALSHLKYDDTLGLVYTIITRDNFIHSGASEHELEEIIDELISNSPEAKLILILYEHVSVDSSTQQVYGILRTQRPLDAKFVANAFFPKGNREQVTFHIHKPMIEAETVVIDTIKKVLRVMMHGA